MLKLIHAFDMKVDNVKNYYDSFEGKEKDLNCYGITQINKGPKEYLDYIHEYEKNLYYLINEENPNYIIGFGSIEDSRILNYHKAYLNTGNIGYGIRPNERHKGFGTILLSLLLIECEKFGMSEVCVSCLRENIGSKNIIEKNNRRQEKEFFDDWSGKYGLKYWIKLHPKMSIRTKRIIKRLLSDTNA